MIFNDLYGNNVITCDCGSFLQVDNSMECQSCEMKYQISIKRRLPEPITGESCKECQLNYGPMIEEDIERHERFCHE